MLEILNNPYFIGIAILVILFFLFQYLDLFPIIKKVLTDWSLDKEGRHLFLNGSRILLLFTVIIILFGTHFKIDLKPFNITPIPFTEFELGLLLAYIWGESFTNYLRNKAPSTNTTLKLDSETTNIDLSKPKTEPVITPVEGLEEVKIPGVNS